MVLLFCQVIFIIRSFGSQSVPRNRKRCERLFCVLIRFSCTRVLCVTGLCSMMHGAIHQVCWYVSFSLIADNHVSQRTLWYCLLTIVFSILRYRFLCLLTTAIRVKFMGTIAFGRSIEGLPFLLNFFVNCLPCHVWIYPNTSNNLILDSVQLVPLH